jgi:hypothetical protein
MIDMGKRKTYSLTLIQDFECLQYDVEIQATSLDEAMELATKPENRPDWVKEVISKAEDLGIIEDRCEVWQFCTLVDGEEVDEDESEEDEEETVSVIAIKNGVVEECYNFSGKNDEIAKLAEKKFLELCSDKISNFDEYTPDDITAILDDGLAEYGGGSINIHWF